MRAALIIFASFTLAFSAIKTEVVKVIKVDTVKTVKIDTVKTVTVDTLKITRTYNDTSVFMKADTVRVPGKTKAGK